MGKPYSINITNGEGSGNVLTGDYTVTAEVAGYDNSSLSPSSLSITAEENQYTLKVGATGTLTIHVSDGAGTNIQNASIIRCDAEGNEYGSAITTDTDGNATMSNVPFSADSNITIYFKQLSSDGEHDFSKALLNTVMTSSTSTYEITNTAPALKTFMLEDLNYSGLKIASGTVTLN